MINTHPGVFFVLRPCSPRPRGFTLVELLVVIVVVAIIAALGAPSIASLLRSSNMNKATSMIIDELNFARQTALTQNRDVEVRFYLLGSKSNPSDTKYRAFRSFCATGSNLTELPLSGVKYLPEPVIISNDHDGSGNIVSTMLNYGGAGLSGLTQAQETLPGVSGTITYTSFMFRATGGTSLAPITPVAGSTVGNWYLTIYLENAPKNAVTGLPDNYFTAQIDPVTGRVRTYRP